MPPLSGKQRRAQLKLKRAVKRGDAPEQPQHHDKRQRQARRPAARTRALESQFVRLDKHFLDHTSALAGSIVLRRPIPSDVAVPRPGWTTPSSSLTIPRRPKWRYQMSKDELDANEHAYFRTWLAQQDTIVEHWQRSLNADSLPADLTNLPADLEDSETRPMPHPPTHFERNIEVWRQFWRVTEISQILLVLLDSRCPLLHLPSSLAAYFNIPTSSPRQSEPGPHSKRPNAPRIILVLTKVDISGPARTASWVSFLNDNYHGVPVISVESYIQKSSLAVEQGPMRLEPHLPGTFREKLVCTLRDVHEQLLQPPHWVTAPRAGESEDDRLKRIDQWKPRVKTVVDWDTALRAKGKSVGKAVGGAAAPMGEDVNHGSEAAELPDDSEEEQASEAHEWKEPEFLTVGVIGQPNVGKSSLLNAIFGTTRVRASRTPGKTKHFQTLFWTSDVRLVDCPGLVMPSFVPMDTQVLSGVLPISRISAVPFCVHQLARLLPLEQILGLAHPSLASSAVVASPVDHDTNAQSSKSPSKARTSFKHVPTVPEDKRTWRPGQRPPEQVKVQSSATRWTANDIMTAYAGKNGWITAKAGRPDIHRAGNAILRLVAEGKIPWGFWPPGSSTSGDDGIWLRDGVRRQAWDERDGAESSEDEDGETSDEETEVSSDEDKVLIRGGRFGALSMDDE